jgi:putative alpha-1,2-mannosidase
VELNGKAYDKGYIEHKDIAAGGTLTFRMGTEKKIWY